MKYTPQFHVVLYRPEIPYNAGSVGRTCVAVGAKLWLVRPLGFQVDDYHLRRAGLDYWQYLEWEVVDDWQALQSRLPSTRQWFFSKTAVREYTDIAYQQGDVFIFGSESQGLPREMIAKAATTEDAALRIPVREQVRSLNLSNSVAVVAYEAIRQWSSQAESPKTRPDGT